MKNHRIKSYHLVVLAAMQLFFVGLAAAESAPKPRPPADTVVSLAREATRITVTLDKYSSSRDPYWLVAPEADSDAARKSVRQASKDKKTLGTVAAMTKQATRSRYFAYIDELFEIDNRLNDALRSAYDAAATLRESERTPAELRVALTHYAVLVRRVSMRSYHTEVPGLEDDPDCRGDVIGSELLQKYFDSLYAADDQNRGLAVTALSDLARQSACLGSEQLDSLSGDFYTAFDQLSGVLQANTREHLVPFVAQALANPLILFYDVNKRQGADSPLAQWFAQNREALREGTRSGRMPIVWHGLWLYDRVTGRLVGFTPQVKARDENYVSLDLLWPSITSAMSVGDANCSFAEMIQRGAGRAGYQCAGYTCAASNPRAGQETRAPAIDIVLSRMRIEADQRRFVQSSMLNCTASGEGPDRSSGDAGCGGGVAGGLGGREAKTVQCISQTIVQPGTEGMRCLAEVTGRCSNPVGQLTKQLQETMYAGVKLGKFCQIGTTAADGKDGGQPGTGGKTKTAEQNKKDQEEKAKEAERQAREALDQLKKAAENRAKGEAELAKAKEAKAREEEASKRMKDAKDAGDDDAFTKAFADWAKAYKDSVTAADNAATEAVEGYMRLDIAHDKVDPKPDGGQRTVCEPGEPCRGKDCTAMASAMDKAMACAANTLSGSNQKPMSRGPGTCDPRICDNFEPTASTPAWQACMTQMDDTVKNAADRSCWAVRCPSGQSAVRSGGGCTCSEAGSTLVSEGRGMRNMCEVAYCTGDTAQTGAGMAKTQGGAWFNGGCACGAASGGIDATSKIPMVLSPAQSFPQQNPRADTFAQPPGMP